MRRRSLLLFVLVMALAAAGTARAQKGKGPKFSASAIQIHYVTAADLRLPPEFQAALYENLIEEVKKTGKFPRIFRDGEKGAGEVKDLVTLRSTVTGFTEGSARARQVTTVAGATKIKVHVQMSTGDGRMIVDRDIDGNVHFFGENLRATFNFAKSVGKLVRENF
jgi:hypothetical protein